MSAVFALAALVVLGLAIRVKRAAGLVLVVALQSCASAQHATYPRADVMTLPTCAMDTGTSWLPDPCRYEVTPGEWLAVRSAQPRAERRGWAWWLLLGLML